MSSLLSGITCSPIGLQYRLAGSQRISVFVQDQDERVCHLRVTPQYLSDLSVVHGCLGHKAIFLVCEKYIISSRNDSEGRANHVKRSKSSLSSEVLFYSWFATTWQGRHVGGQYNKIFSRRIYMKIEFSSQRREMLLFLTTNMAAVTSRANQQYLLPNNVFWYPGYQRLLMRSSRPRSSLYSDAREKFFFSQLRRSWLRPSAEDLSPCARHRSIQPFARKKPLVPRAVF